MNEIVVISGKGGTGKSSFTAALAHVGNNIVIADCDVDAPDLHIILKPQTEEKNKFIGGRTASIDESKCIKCGKCLSYCKFDAITNDIKIDEISCEGCGVCEIVCPANAITFLDSLNAYWKRSYSRFGPFFHADMGIGEENSGKLVTFLRQKAKDYAQKNGQKIVLIDGSPGIGCPVIASLTGVKLALIITEPSLSGISDLKRVVKLINHFGIKALAVINKSTISKNNTETIKQICKDNEIELVCEVPQCLDFIDAQINQQAITEFIPNSPISNQIRSLWNIIEQKLSITERT